MALTGEFRDYVKCPRCRMWVLESEFDFVNETHKRCINAVIVVDKQ